MARQHVTEVFPELADIEDDELREGVIDAWATSMVETGVDDLRTVPWFPPVMTDLGIEDESLVDHVRDVIDAAVAISESLLDRRDVSLSIDTVLAGALVHDVSKLYEFGGMDLTPVGDLLGHPYYGVHVVARAGLPVELSHVVLSHSHRTAVEPATLEAVVVERADTVAAAAIRATAVDALRDA